MTESQETGEPGGENEGKKKPGKKILLICLLILILAVGTGIVVSKFFSDPIETDGNYYVCGLAPAFDGDLYGYVNEAGDFEIEPIYENAEPFNANGVACVSIGGKWGHINEKGELLVKPQFDRAYDFNKNDVALMFKDDKCGIIGIDGEVIVQPKYEWREDIFELGEFAENGLAYFFESDKGGYLNTKGEVVIPAQYDYVYDFAENGLALVKKDDLYGFVDETGKEVIECQYDVASTFFKNYPAMVSKDGKYGYINSAGEEVIPLQYTGASLFNAGYASVEDDDGKWGAIDTEGTMVIEPQFDDAFYFSADHYAIVNQEGSAYLMNENGEILCCTGLANDAIGQIETLWDLITVPWYIETGSSQYYRNRIESLELFPNNISIPFGIPSGYNWEWNYGYDYLYGYLSAQGDITIEAEYTIAYPFAQNGLARVSTRDASEGFIDMSGEYVIQPKYSYFENDFQNAAIVVGDKEDGVEILDELGNVLETIDFEDANLTSADVDVYSDGYVSIKISKKKTQYSPYKTDREIVYKGTEKVYDSDHFKSA